MSRTHNDSAVMDEFARIAIEAGLISVTLKPEGKDPVGNPSKETPVKDHRRYEPTEEYGVTKDEIGRMPEAHPKEVSVADAMGKGGVVEDEIARQEHDIYVATKMPTGALIGVHASLVEGLISLADILDGAGRTGSSDRVDETIRRLANFPFDGTGQLYKSAWFWPVVGLVSAFAPSVVDWFRAKKEHGFGKGKSKVPSKPVGRLGKGLFGGTASIILGIQLLQWIGEKFTSTKDGIVVDVQDLYEILSDASTDSKEAAVALQLFRPSAEAFKSVDLSSKEGIAAFARSMNKLENDLPRIRELVEGMAKITKPGWSGLSISRRALQKLETLQESFEDAKEYLTKARSVAEKAGGYAKSDLQDLSQAGMEPTGIGAAANRIAALQTLLFRRGFPRGEIWSGKVTGMMDENTVRAAEELEAKMDDKLSGYARQKGLSGSFRGEIVSDNQVKADPRRLLRIMDEVEKLP